MSLVENCLIQPHFAPNKKKLHQSVFVKETAPNKGHTGAKRYSFYVCLRQVNAFSLLHFERVTANKERMQGQAFYLFCAGSGERPSILTYHIPKDILHSIGGRADGISGTCKWSFLALTNRANNASNRAEWGWDSWHNYSFCTSPKSCETSSLPWACTHLWGLWCVGRNNICIK